MEAILRENHDPRVTREIRELIEDLERIVDFGPGEIPAGSRRSIIGLDFIAIGDDRATFRDFLYHPDFQRYLDSLKGYFNSNPSLLLVPEFNQHRTRVIRNAPGSDEIRSIEFVGPLDIRSDQFHVVASKERSEEYWTNWCKVIEDLYPDCCSVFFTRVDFEKVQNTALFVYFNRDIETELEANGLRDYFEKTCTAFLYKKGVEVFLPQHIREIELQARRAAVSQVLARCFSHDTGSHVLARFMTVDEIERLVGWNGGQYIGAGLGFSPNTNGGEKFRNEQIAIFNRYLKTRLDFLADIAAGAPALESPMNIRDEILRGLHENKIMLDRISGIDDPAFEFDIEFRRWNGTSSVYESVETDAVSLFASIPNDVLGCQALYIIVENVIRNTVKHSRSELPAVVRFCIDLKDHPWRNDLWEVRIHDNVFGEKHQTEELVAQRNATINRPILDPVKYSVRQAALGTIEMDVCAAYLRKVPPEQVDDEKYTVNESRWNLGEWGKTVPNLIYAYLQPEAGDASSERAALGYCFCLRKPQYAVIIDQLLAAEISEEVRLQLEAAGISVIDPNDLTNSLKDKSAPILNQQFLAHTGELPPEMMERYRKVLPDRIVRIPETRLADLRSGVKNIEIRTIKKLLAEENAFNLMRKKGVDRIDITSSFARPSSFTLDPSVERSFRVMFDNHGSVWPGLGDDGRPQYDSFFYVGSHHRIGKEVLTHRLSAPLYKTDIVEVALTSVGILDERIQAFATSADLSRYNIDGQPDGQIPYIDLFRAQGILIPDPRLRAEGISDAPLEPDLNSHDLVRSQQDWIAGWCTRNIDSLDYVVIHLGLIEKLILKYEKDPASVEAKIYDLVGSGNYEKVVITSGRGMPSNLPDNTYYVPFPALQNTVVTQFDKYLLVKLMHNARAVRFPREKTS